MKAPTSTTAEFHGLQALCAETENLLSESLKAPRQQLLSEKRLLVTEFRGFETARPGKPRSSALHYSCPPSKYLEYISGGEVPLKVRGWLLMLLFAHVMLHPWVHTMGIGKAADGHTVIANASHAPEAATTAGDQCELCRVGHNATLTPKLPQVDLLNPHWIHTALQSVNYASLQGDRRVSSRAPPTL